MKKYLAVSFSYVFLFFSISVTSVSHAVPNDKSSPKSQVVWTEAHWIALADWAEAAIDAGMPDHEVEAFVNFQYDIVMDVYENNNNGPGGGGPGGGGPGGGGPGGGMMKCWACDGNQTPTPIYPDVVQISATDVGYFFQVVGSALTIRGATRTGGSLIIIGTVILWINEGDNDDDGGEDDEKSFSQCRIGKDQKISTAECLLAWYDYNN